MELELCRSRIEIQLAAEHLLPRPFNEPNFAGIFVTCAKHLLPKPFNEPTFAGISVEDLEREQQREVNKVNKGERKESMKNMKEENALTNAREDDRGFGGGNRGHDGSKAGSEGPGGEGFNYDQIIEGINLNSLLGGSSVHQQEVPVAQVVPQGSRFSQFFAPRGQPGGGIGEDGSRRGSLQELQKELGQEGPTIAIPSPNQEERYFAPISPAAQTRTMTNNLMDMIGKGPAQPPVGGGGGRVQELEDGIRRQLGLGLPQPPPPQVHPQQQQGHPANVYRTHAGAGGGHMPVKDQVHAQEQENMSAFKKLVSFKDSNENAWVFILWLRCMPYDVQYWMCPNVKPLLTTWSWAC